MRRKTRYDPTPVAADPLWDVMGPPGESIVGPKGERGEPGLSIEGKPGADAQGWNFRGVWKRTVEYNVNDVVTDDGSTYLALESNKGKSPPSKRYWALLAAAGESADPVVYQGQRGRPGRDGTTTIITAGEGTPTPAIFDSTTSKGMAVFVSGDGHVDLALADDLSTSSVIGLAASDVGDGFAGLVETDGTFELEDWTLVLGSEFLTPGLAVYASATVPGGLSHDPPEPAAGVCVTYVGRALSATELLIEIGQPVVLVEPPEE